MDFISPAIEEDGPKDEETMPVDGEAAAPEDGGNEAAAHEDRNNDEDADA